MARAVAGIPARTNERESGSERPPSWTVGFHGGLSHADLASAGGVSIREIALGHRSIGAASMDVLTELPTSSPGRSVPTSEDGRLHVGLNGEPRTSEPTVPPAEKWDPVKEPLDSYLERRLQEASFLFLPNRGRGYRYAKRALDIVGALVLLVLTAPIMLTLAIIIRFDSPGAAIFKQTRVTRGGRLFRFYKFRTMYVDARERFPDLYSYDYNDSEFDDSYYKLADDPRNTRFGRWLRRTTLDELPNLFNVLKGDLSLVGPRPELPDLVRYYKPEELACFFTKAGLTGLAQVAGRSLLTVRERLTLDTRYVAQQTMLLDLRILWRTLLVVVARKGAF